MSVTPPSRDLRTAAAVFAVVAILLPLAWQARTPQAPVATVATAAPAAAAAAPVPDAADSATQTPRPFDLNVAMNLAGEQVPPELESFYFVALIEPASHEADVADIGLRMTAAAAERDYLGVAGPDAERNRQATLAAFAAHADDDLSGMILIYLGPEPHRDALATAAARARVDLRFVPYVTADTL